MKPKTLTDLFALFGLKCEEAVSSQAQLFHSVVRLPYFLDWGERPKVEFFREFEGELSHFFVEKLAQVFESHSNDTGLVRIFANYATSQELLASPDYRLFAQRTFRWRRQIEALQNSVIKVDFYMADISGYFTKKYTSFSGKTPPTQINISQLLLLYSLKALLLVLRKALSMSFAQIIGSLISLFSVFAGLSGDILGMIFGDSRWPSLIPLALAMKTTLPTRVQRKIDTRISAEYMQALSQAFEETSGLLLKADSLLAELLEDYMRESGKEKPSLAQTNDLTAKAYRVLEYLLFSSKQSAEELDSIVSGREANFRVIDGDWVAPESSSDEEWQELP